MLQSAYAGACAGTLVFDNCLMFPYLRVLNVRYLVPTKYKQCRCARYLVPPKYKKDFCHFSIFQPYKTHVKLRILHDT